MSQRKAVTKKKALAYKNANRTEKSRILDEIVELTGWHRDYARAALREALVLKVVKPRPGRTPLYGPDLLAPLITCGATLRAPAGKLLAAMMPVLVPMLRRDKDITVTGDYDFLMDAWLPATHEDYIAEYGEQMEDLGAWNNEAALTIAVNEDAPITSLDELAENADEFNNQLIGVEPGAGLTRITTDEVIPTYGLEDMEYTTSSTPAMLQELLTAIDLGDNVVVTLWRPHWAYDEFPIRDLEDPEGALGEAESIHTFANPTFVEENPDVADWLRNFEMDSDTLHSLENLMFNENPDTDDYQPVVEEWVADNQEYVDGLTN